MDIFKDIRMVCSRKPITVIVIIGIVMRLIVSFLYQHITIYPDSGGYIALAARILDLDLTGYQGERSPGYPLLLALSLNYKAVAVLLQSLAGIVSLVLIYRIGMVVRLPQKLAFALALCNAVYLPLMFYELAILSESLTLLVMLATFYILFGLLYEKRRGAVSYFLLALCCGYLVLIKPFYIFVSAIFVIVLLFCDKRSRCMVLYQLFVFLLPVFVLVGWSYVNKLNTGYFVPTTFYGFNAAQNCVSFADKTSCEYKDIGNIYAKYRDRNVAIGRNTSMSVWEAYDELAEETALPFTELSARLYDYSLATIKLNVGMYLRQVAISWIDFWKTSFYWQPENIHSEACNSLILGVGWTERVILQFVKVLFVLLIPVNLILLARKRRFTAPVIISVVVFAASVLQAMASYGTNSRFSFPFEALIMISVVVNVMEIYRSRANKKAED